MDLTATLNRWRVQRAEDHQIAQPTQGSPTVDILTAPGNYAWYVLPRTDPQAAWELGPGRRWEMTVHVALEGDIQLELWLAFCADHELKEGLARKRLLIQPGANRFGLWVKDHAVFVRPAFQIRRAGRFCVKSFVFEGH